jgi:hypothetical protein
MATPLRPWEKKESPRSPRPTAEPGQIINLRRVLLWCSICEAPREAKNRDNVDVCCETCSAIIFTIHPKK